MKKYTSKTSKDYQLLWDLIKEHGLKIPAFINPIGVANRLFAVVEYNSAGYQIKSGLFGYVPNKSMWDKIPSAFDRFLLDCQYCNLEFIVPEGLPKEELPTSYTFGLEVKKKSGKPNGKSYKISTISDLFHAVNTENVDRLSADLKNILHLYANQKSALMSSKGITEEMMKDIEASFEWIDD